ncbi:hypothetical protein [Roseibium aggregatum]|uniref:hypothetical protein n=1 Tax=Roseibium aggregatum TaxID=187304 RepID=UPI0006E1703C|nr:hypothetical protein [Roseibium aggregatum]
MPQTTVEPQTNQGQDEIDRTAAGCASSFEGSDDEKQKRQPDSITSQATPPDVLAELGQYDVAKGDCCGISRVLLNEVRACEIEGGPSEDCLLKLQISARSEIDFIL